MEQHSRHTSQALVRPTTGDPAAWRTYWQTQDQGWRTEREISLERQEELRRCLEIVPDIVRGIYPFKGMKLERADVEWLLAMHDAGQGLVNWANEQNEQNEQKRQRFGLDMRGADLRRTDLHGLPLTKLRGGLTFSEYLDATEAQCNGAAVLLEGANLLRAQLKGANLLKAQLKGANLRKAQLEGTDLQVAQLKGANLEEAQLEGAYLQWAELEGANLRGAWLEGANLQWAQLDRADLREAELEGANLRGAQLEGADLREAQLERACLGGIKLGNKQRIGPCFADAQWGNANLAVVDWSQVSRLGDEREARRRKTGDGKKKERRTRLREYQAAVRANRQLALALQAQGLNEEAARFAYRAHRLQRIVFRRQRKFGRYLFSSFLNLLAGYGYKPGRSVLAYLVVIVGFMMLYLLNAQFVAPHLRWDEALVLSVSSFHGRGFFAQDISLGDTYARLAAAEAVIGIIIEISFIATFTQRFLGK